MTQGMLAPIEPPALQLVGMSLEPPQGSAPAAAELYRRHRGTIFLTTAAGLGAALAITALQTPLYTATSSVQIEQSGIKLVGEEEGNDVADAKRQLNTHLEILRSERLAGRVASDLGMVGNPALYEKMGEDVPSDLAAKDEAAKEASAAKLLASNVEIAMPRDSRVARINFTSADPEFSAAVANAYSDGLIKLDHVRRHASLAYTRDYLSGELTKAEGTLEASQRELNAYARQAGLINIGANGDLSSGGGTVTQASLLQLNQALSEARARRIDAQNKLGAASGSSVFNVPEVVANPAVQKLLTDRATQEVKVAEARERYTAEHPVMISEQARLDQTKDQLAAIAGSVRQSLATQYSSARGAEAALAGQVAALKSASLGEQDRSVRYNLLRNAVETNQSLVNSLSMRLNEVSTASGITPNNISVLDVAAVPGSPSSPRPLINAVAGLLLGFIAGLALALFREKTDSRIRRGEDIERKLSLSTLGQIPYVRGLEDRSLMTALHDSGSLLGAYFTELRTSLLVASHEGLPSAIAVTSGEEGEGKSTTALALAQSLARSGKRILLVEADMRRDTITDLLDLHHSPGLSDVLMKRTTLLKAIQPTDFDRLDAIAAGAIEGNPTDMLDPTHLRSLLRQAESYYDCVVLDAPPVSVLGDASLIAAAARNVILVVSARASDTNSAQSAMEKLRSTQARILGAVLTQAAAPNPRSSYLRRLAPARSIDVTEAVA